MQHAIAGLWVCSLLGHVVCASEPPGDLSEVVVRAPEPRFVAPTLRDRIGRIWAPVWINGKGPFRLVLDTGANHSGLAAQVADRPGIPLDQSSPVWLRGVTGVEMVPTIRVDSFTVGDLVLSSSILPIVTDAMGGAEGVLATNEFEDQRIVIDFRHDRIDIRRSRGERTPANYIAIPLERSRTGLLVFHAQVGGVRVEAIVDTGGQATIGNLAMRDVLVRRRVRGETVQIYDVTDQAQSGELLPCPPIEFGALRILNANITYGQMQVFEHWHLTKEPALLLGMDVIGLLDVFIIDYRRHLLELLMRDDQRSKPLR